MAKSIIDQTAAWIIGVMCSALFFGGISMVVKVVTYKSKKDEQKIDSAAIMEHFFEDAPDDKPSAPASSPETPTPKPNTAANPAGKPVAQAKKEMQDTSSQARPSAKTAAEQPVAEALQEPLSWSYRGKTGPDYWGDIEKTFVDCKLGRHQSPVDLVRARLEYELKEYTLDYRQLQVTLAPHPLLMRLNVTSPHSTVRGQTRFTLKFIDLHLPSEHLVDGLPYDGEIQLWHQGKERWLAIAVFLEETGQENAALQKWIALQPESTVEFDLSELGGLSGAYFAYRGSQTHPPCREEVDWIVFKKTWTASTEQINQLLRRYRSNARKVQGLFKREIRVSPAFK
ncbi:MAG: carbonic anhydrase family protein [Zetaproteobacteria bacterium]|nr:carbonic anhydrase family protein [Zetaproteobacteria bacterium]